ncbi:MAG: hypothetical protein KGL39_54770 [Patescibacteria group bacterium]|nr:hypothetical protein [Patescibacteria group bacterium]
MASNQKEQTAQAELNEKATAARQAKAARNKAKAKPQAAKATWSKQIWNEEQLQDIDQTNRYHKAREALLNNCIGQPITLYVGDRLNPNKPTEGVRQTYKVIMNAPISMGLEASGAKMTSFATFQVSEALLQDLLSLRDAE